MKLSIREAVMMAAIVILLVLYTKGCVNNTTLEASVLTSNAKLDSVNNVIIGLTYKDSLLELKPEIQYVEAPPVYLNKIKPNKPVVIIKDSITTIHDTIKENNLVFDSLIDSVYLLSDSINNNKYFFAYDVYTKDSNTVIRAFIKCHNECVIPKVSNSSIVLKYSPTFPIGNSTLSNFGIQYIYKRLSIDVMQDRLYFGYKINF